MALVYPTKIVSIIGFKVIVDYTELPSIPVKDSVLKINKKLYKVYQTELEIPTNESGSNFNLTVYVSKSNNRNI